MNTLTSTLKSGKPKVEEALKALGVQIDRPKGYTVEPSKNGDKWTVRNVWGERVGTYADQAKAQAVADKGTNEHFGAGGQRAYMNLGGNTLYPSAGKNVEASKKLLEAGIPGIRYKDAGSRGTDAGTYNYVVFDDKLIEILRKYGLLGMAGGAAANEMLSAGQQQQPTQRIWNALMRPGDA